MIKKKKSQITEETDRALAELQNMRHRDLQKACIVRGMDFNEVLESSTPGLSNWFITNFDRGQDSTLLNTFDSFVENKLSEKGYTKDDAIMSPDLRLGFVSNVVDKSGIPQLKRVIPIDKPIVKRERDDSGLFTGTKKSLTFQLAKDGVPLAEAIEKVKEKFPQAVDKSIKIWYKKALK